MKRKLMIKRWIALLLAIVMVGESISWEGIVAYATEQQEHSTRKTYQSQYARFNKDKKVTVTVSNHTSVELVRLEYKLNNEWILVGEEEASSEGMPSNQVKAVFEWNNAELTDGNYEIRMTVVHKNGSSTYYQTVTVDNTGISKIKITNITSTNSQVYIKWENPIEEDFSYVKVEEKVNAEFVEIKKVSDANEAYIENLNQGKEYTFRVVGYDDLGNRGEPSDEVIIKTKAETNPPVIESIQSQGSRINKDSQITVNAYDDIGVASILLEYKNGEEWTLIEEKKATNGQAIFTWDNSALSDTTYTIRATAIDVNGNRGIDEYTRNYTVDNTGISKINVTDITSGTTHVSLSWEDVSEEDFAYFQVE